MADSDTWETLALPSKQIVLDVIGCVSGCGSLDGSFVCLHRESSGDRKESCQRDSGNPHFGDNSDREVHMTKEDLRPRMLQSGQLKLMSITRFGSSRSQDLEL